MTWHRRARRRKSDTKRRLSVICASMAIVGIIVLLYLSLPRTEYSSTKGGVAIVDSFYSSDPGFTDQVDRFIG